MQLGMENPHPHTLYPVCSGGAFERGLRRVFRDVALGSLLIQSDPKNGEPLLLHTMIPNAVRDRHKAVNTWVLLLDAQVSRPQATFCIARLNRPVPYVHLSLFLSSSPIFPFPMNPIRIRGSPVMLRPTAWGGTLHFCNTMDNTMYLPPNGIFTPETKR